MAGTEPRHIRFIRAHVAVLDDGSAEATVEIERHGKGVYVSTARGPSGPADQIRAVARAASDVLSEAFDVNVVRVRVVSAQLVEALTKTAVLVTLAASRGADHHTLLGICEATDDLPRATALAVLNATNRYLGLASEAE